MLLRRPINKIVLLVENEMVRFPTEETSKGQGDMITWGEPYVEALRNRVKIKLWDGETVLWPFANSPLMDVNCLITQQLNWSLTQLVCAWIGHVHRVYVRNKKDAIITVIIN